MVTLDEIESSLLQKPSSDDAPSGAPVRATSNYKSLDSFVLEKNRGYQQQFGDMYFLRLTKIKPAVEEVAEAVWHDTVIGGEKARQVERVLDVRQGQLCWVVGTVYVDMPLKPNILEDVSKDRWISAPSSTEKYYAGDDRDAVMLEDDSGRIRLVGDELKKYILVTGCIIAVMGTENANGEFEVIDLKFPDLAPQPERWALGKPAAANGNSSNKPTQGNKEDDDVEMGDDSKPVPGSKIAIVSGLEVSGSDSSHTTELALLLEYLLGEALDPAAQTELAHISRLIIAGNSVAAENKAGAGAGDEAGEGGGPKKSQHKKYGYDASSYNPTPARLFDDFLAKLLPSMPVTLLPGVSDPANASYPQQPMHPAMFPHSRAYVAAPNAAAKEPGWLDAVTNPWEGEVEGWRVLGTAGQNVDDICRYVEGDDRLALMEATCRWRCSAPTAPDTLWAYPFQEDEPFVMRACPHLYFVANQPAFGTRVITGPQGQVVRLVLVPRFAESKELVLVDSETLDVTRVKIAL